MSKLDDAIAGLAERNAQQLRIRWEQLTASTCPALPEPLLRRLISHRLQENRLGALPAAVARELKRSVAGKRVQPMARAPAHLTPGTQLVREWNGQTINVEVVEDGFVHADRTWRSLSEIARHVTGAHWSGPRFFGLSTNG